MAGYSGTQEYGTIPIMTKNKIKSYICPSCGETENTALAVKTVEKTYTYDLETEDLIEDNYFEDSDKFEYVCPDCHEPLPENITESFAY